MSSKEKQTFFRHHLAVPLISLRYSAGVRWNTSALTHGSSSLPNLLKVPFQIFAWDNITWGSFSLNLLILPVIGIGALLGIRMVKLFPEKAFRRFIQFVTILSVAMMLV